MINEFQTVHGIQDQLSSISLLAAPVVSRLLENQKAKPYWDYPSAKLEFKISKIKMILLDICIC